MVLFYKVISFNNVSNGSVTVTVQLKEYQATFQKTAVEVDKKIVMGKKALRCRWLVAISGIMLFTNTNLPKTYSAIQKL